MSKKGSYDPIRDAPTFEKVRLLVNLWYNVLSYLLNLDIINSVKLLLV